MSAELREIISDVPNEIRLKPQAGEELSTFESYRYYQWLGSTMRTYETWWKQLELETIDDRTFRSYVSHMENSLREESIRDYRLNYKPYWALPEFEAFVSKYFGEDLSAE